jgi:hypothetical protein
MAHNSDDRESEIPAAARRGARQKAELTRPDRRFNVAEVVDFEAIGG